MVDNIIATGIGGHELPLGDESCGTGSSQHVVRGGTGAGTRCTRHFVGLAKAWRRSEG